MCNIQWIKMHGETVKFVLAILCNQPIYVQFYTLSYIYWLANKGNQIHQ